MTSNNGDQSRLDELEESLGKVVNLQRALREYVFSFGNSTLRVQEDMANLKPRVEGTRTEFQRLFDKMEELDQVTTDLGGRVRNLEAFLEGLEQVITDRLGYNRQESEEN